MAQVIHVQDAESGKLLAACPSKGEDVRLETCVLLEECHLTLQPVNILQEKLPVGIQATLTQVDASCNIHPQLLVCVPCTCHVLDAYHHDPSYHLLSDAIAVACFG